MLIRALEFSTNNCTNLYQIQYRTYLVILCDGQLTSSVIQKKIILQARNCHLPQKLDVIDGEERKQDEEAPKSEFKLKFHIRYTHRKLLDSCL
ncbi:hypothetical protein OUZ56_027397 [Daphnia magna]|uniref:Uncharacterized protein n=1 Tax=Daphnia magna TaxID=35525 RepID=A0ABQ9ZR06_9CRUS|nr:hypothetical protein OUZ56_027397 [Daphnia magna]